MKRMGAGPPRTLDVLAAGKINLGWEVGPPRDDGYHDVRGCLQTVALFDRLHVETHATAAEVKGAVTVDVSGASVGLDVSGEEAVDELLSTDNLIIESARRLAAVADPQPTSLRLEKAIPVAAGLGGGSADAAAALMGLSLGWSARVNAGELLRVGAEVGSDVPAILLGGLVHASGRGEAVRSLGSSSGYAIVLGVGRTTLSTANVYRALDEIRGSVPPRTERRWEANDLEAAAVSLAPEIGEGLEAMRTAGAAVVFLAGSGPTVVGVVPDPQAAPTVADRVRDRFRRVIVTEPVGWGVRLSLSGRKGV